MITPPLTVGMLEQSLLKDDDREGRTDEAREKLTQQREQMKDEIGTQVFEVLEEFFPEQSKAQRRAHAKKALLVGIAIGFLLRHLVDR